MRSARLRLMDDRAAIGLQTERVATAPQPESQSIIVLEHLLGHASAPIDLTPTRSDRRHGPIVENHSESIIVVVVDAADVLQTETNITELHKDDL